MLYIVEKTTNAYRTVTTSWHLGGDIEVNINDVVEVQADCDELEHIRRQFSNIPNANKRVVRWFGDIAKFIVANLR